MYKVTKTQRHTGHTSKFSFTTYAEAQDCFIRHCDKHEMDYAIEPVTKNMYTVENFRDFKIKLETV